MILLKIIKTSRSSFKNITSLAEFANGQNLSNPSTKSVDKDGSFDKKSIEHLNNYSW